MSKYTEKEINDAIEIVQAALEDDEVEHYVRSAARWYTTCDLTLEFDYRAKKKPRDFWLVIIDEDRENGSMIYAYDFDPTDEWYRGTEIVHVKEVD